ncbi:bifunctional DNA primase/polymerase [Levilactobacillus brevis]|uniref:bifunctional DNA primase/polymerase n=1 Tax=Levilactobacillus brevis TaxID=1580 RepID=UPI001C10B428|nr:bifunctional DNA primase/polymerase [Levilactobacillus brevis]MBU5274532.1 bifunctional DNA primase/polymerase [Levilactobacillus brevis]MDV2567080.1 bifunctional DNA primase/polymerase [Levilactobacillus brevis]MDV2585877.1 bifunctional DNA primase/polymerase [Levilactobacillus brevis]
MKEFASLYAALDLVESGYEIYPLSANTKIPPKGHHGYSEATRDQNTIWDWFQNNPDYNLGLALDTSHLLVVDVDIHESAKNGKDSLMKLQRQGKTLPNDTYIEKTAGGGLHYFFKYVGAKIRKVDVWPGIDLLTDFTVIAPSEINAKPYEALDGRTLADVKPAPNWLVAELTGQKANWTPENVYATRTKKYTGKLLDEMVNGTEQGNRNAWLTKMIGRLFATGAEPETVYELSCSINERFIDQPLETKEVTTIYNSILKREMKRFERNSVRNSRIAG